MLYYAMLLYVITVVDKVLMCCPGRIYDSLAFWYIQITPTILCLCTYIETIFQYDNFSDAIFDI